MSANKHKALERRLKIMRRAGRSGILLNTEGGMARDNRDLQRLAHDGLVKIERDPGIPKWSRRFSDLIKQPYFNGTEMIRRTRAYLTESGRNFLNKH